MDGIKNHVTHAREIFRACELRFGEGVIVIFNFLIFLNSQASKEIDKVF